MSNVIINYNQNNVSLKVNLTKKELYGGVSNVDVVRYLKGIFTNENRFESRFLGRLRSVRDMFANDLSSGKFNGDVVGKPEDFECNEFMDELMNTYREVESFTYSEAFAISDANFRALVFGSIDITEMIEELGHTRLKTEGKRVKHKIFSESGEFLGYNEYDNIYEVHEVSGEKLSLTNPLYVLKCWCTTTNKEHWIWIDAKFKDNPLEAVASTFRVHKNLIPFIKEIKRQGDILLVEMLEGVEIPEAEGEIVPLNAEQYFGLLTCQS